METNFTTSVGPAGSVWCDRQALLLVEALGLGDVDGDVEHPGHPVHHQIDFGDFGRPAGSAIRARRGDSTAEAAVGSRSESWPERLGRRIRGERQQSAASSDRTREPTRQTESAGEMRGSFHQ